MNDFPKDRYDPEEFVRLFDSTDIEVCDDEFIKSFEVKGEEFEIYFPNLDGIVISEYVQKARRALLYIREMDNLVQESCENECESTGIHKRNFQLYLAYITVQENEIALRYYGQRVNTEWDAVFRETGEGKWEGVNL